jgi:hypothetical protein
MTPPESISISSSRSDRMPPNQRAHNSELLSREPGSLSALFACCSSANWNPTGHIVTMPAPLFEHKPLISGSLNPEALLRPTTALSDPVALLGFTPVEAIRSSAESDASVRPLGLARWRHRSAGGGCQVPPGYMPGRSVSPARCAFASGWTCSGRGYACCFAQVSAFCGRRPWLSVGWAAWIPVRTDI